MATASKPLPPQVPGPRPHTPAAQTSQAPVSKEAPVTRAPKPSPDPRAQDPQLDLGPSFQTQGDLWRPWLEEGPGCGPWTLQTFKTGLAGYMIALLYLPVWTRARRVTACSCTFSPSPRPSFSLSRSAWRTVQQGDRPLVTFAIVKTLPQHIGVSPLCQKLLNLLV